MKMMQRSFALAAFIALNLSLLSAQMQKSPHNPPPQDAPPFVRIPQPREKHHGRNNDSPYRGKRITPPSNDIKSETVFCIEGISVKENHDFILIQIFFNLPIDPLSVKSENILINEKQLHPKAIVKFGRMGNMLQIVIPSEETNHHLKEDDVFEIQIPGIFSYNALTLQKSRFNDIRCGEPYFFTE